MPPAAQVGHAYEDRDLRGRALEQRCERVRKPLAVDVGRCVEEHEVDVVASRGGGGHPQDRR